MPVASSFSTPIGDLTVEADGREVVRVRFGTGMATGGGGTSTTLGRAVAELQEYFSGARKAFSLAIRRPKATAFQHRVWDALLRIPFGQTRTYGEVARELGTSARAVGGACARNELPILIPCHRVVAKAGLGGFSGEWETGLALSVKAALLAHEQTVLHRPGAGQ